MYFWKSPGRDRGKTGRAIIGAFLAALVIKILIVDLMITDGHSMVPAVKPGAILIVCRIYYGFRLPGSINYLFQWRTPKEGDVVVFFTPHGDIAVKRCGEIIDGEMFYALGDNESQSFDSRSYGPVPNKNIIGQALGIK
jgi:signal peptidase I